MIEDKNFIAEETKAGVQITAKENAFVKEDSCSVELQGYEKFLLDVGTEYGTVEVHRMNFQLKTPKEISIKKDSLYLQLLECLNSNLCDLHSFLEISEATGVAKNILSPYMLNLYKAELVDRRKEGNYLYTITPLGQRKLSIFYKQNKTEDETTIL